MQVPYLQIRSTTQVHTVPANKMYVAFTLPSNKKYAASIIKKFQKINPSPSKYHLVQTGSL